MGTFNRICASFAIASMWLAGHAAALWRKFRYALKQLFNAREQIYALLRDEKWLILVSFLLALALSLPGQIAELYRAEYTNGIAAQNWLTSLSHFGLLHGSIILICTSIWLGAHQIASVTRASIQAPKRGLVPCVQRLPVMVSIMPLAGCAYGLLLAVPTMSATDLEAAKIPGSIWQQLSQDKQIDAVRLALYLGSALQVVLSISLLVFAPRIQRRLRRIARKLNIWYPNYWAGLLLAIGFSAAITTLFVAVPVTLAQWIGPFAIVLLFTVCLTAFVVSLTLISMRFKVPTVSVLILLAIVFSLADWTDNHQVRYLKHSNSRLAENSQRFAVSEFETWLASKSNRAQYPDGYPVYIVAAQGGGIYAAYQAAIFLARLQDTCPQFRHHLFAISSVSGGSLGAAVFTAALRAQDRKTLKTTPSSSPASNQAISDPCPAIGRYLGGDAIPDTLESPGPLERAMQEAFKADFLSPLIGAALFGDFSQRFFPYAFGFLDRARALEYTLEAGGRSFLSIQRPKPEDNALETSLLNLWDSKRPLPALLMNTTDAASGRRFVIAPFRFAAPSSTKELGAVADYQFWNPSTPERPSRDLRLSTAAVMSARFPLVTPAASIEHTQHYSNVEGEVVGLTTKVKLVDGGYVDNSGVETALDLKALLDEAATRQKVNLNLIVLTGGDFPIRRSYALGETMEPVRAILNTRTSRAYVAIERAERIFNGRKKPVTFRGKTLTVNEPTITKATLDNRFYQMPLGWAISARTRLLIENQSGRYWDCEVDSNMAQARKGLSSADCVQYMIHHVLSGTVFPVAERVAISRHLQRGTQINRADEEKIKVLITCYVHKSVEAGIRPTSHIFTIEQGNNMRALIHLWRRGRSKNFNALIPYMMATAAKETAEFRARRETLNYTSVEKIIKTWRRRFETVPREEIEALYLRNPKVLAERVYADRGGNGVGTGDSWTFRGRGLAFVTLKNNYIRWGKAADFDELVDKPELVFIPAVNAKIFIESRFPEQRLPQMQELLQSKRLHELRKVILNVSEQNEEEDKLIADEINIRYGLFSRCFSKADLH